MTSNNPFKQWWNDLRLTLKTAKSPRASDPDWKLSGTVESKEMAYGIFLAALCLIPAVAVFFLKSKAGVGEIPFVQSPAFPTSIGPEPLVPDWRPMQQLVSTPLYIFVDTVLMALFLFIGAKFSGFVTDFHSTARIALRVMSVRPILSLLLFSSAGQIFILFTTGFFTANAAIASFGMSRRNAYVFFTAVYGVFAILELKQVILYR